MKTRPIPMSAPMVPPTLDGTKTQTRRLRGLDEINAAPDTYALDHIGAAGADGRFCATFCDIVCPGYVPTIIPSPYGQPGDRLWVREAWRVAACYDDKSGAELSGILSARNVQYEVAADRFLHGDAIGRLRPSMFMPRWASRITLEITGIRVERLQDISEADAIAEGWPKRPEVSDDPAVHFDAARDWYADLWEQINGAGSWNQNPWVWVIEFIREAA